jgi:hypothetical protein
MWTLTPRPTRTSRQTGLEGVTELWGRQRTRLVPNRARAGRGQGRRDRGPDAQAQRPIPAAVSSHELGGGRPGHEVVGGSGQAGATPNHEGAADDGARDPRDRVLTSDAGDQRAGGREPAGDRRAPGRASRTIKLKRLTPTPTPAATSHTACRQPDRALRARALRAARSA